MQPMTFVPLLKRLRWGGRRLGTILGKSIGPESDFAESWEICDHGNDQSLVASGPYRGRALSQLVIECGRELLGRHAGLVQFPLLLKFLDASDRLSVQVHPNDEQARLYDPAERGKTEAWVIIAAEPGSVVYSGLKSGVTQQQLSTHILNGTVEDCLHRVSVSPGDCLFIPAGTVHAIGEGILLAEVQQSSDLTFRLFDWNRVGADGKPRALHPEQSLACIDFDRGPVDPVKPEAAGPGIERLVRCPYFNIVRRSIATSTRLAPTDHCRILMVLEGSLEFDTDDGRQALKTGETLLVPAASKELTLAATSPARFLEIDWS